MANELELERKLGEAEQIILSHRNEQEGHVGNQETAAGHTHRSPSHDGKQAGRPCAACNHDYSEHGYFVGGTCVAGASTANFCRCEGFQPQTAAVDEPKPETQPPPSHPAPKDSHIPAVPQPSTELVSRMAEALRDMIYAYDWSASKPAARATAGLALAEYDRIQGGQHVSTEL